MAAKKTRITVSIDGTVLRKLDRAAKAMGLSRSAVAKDLIDGALGQSEFLVKALSNDRVRRAFAAAMTTPGVAAAVGQSLGHELTDLERQDVLAFFKAGEGAVTERKKP